MHAERAGRAIVITAGYFTSEARAWTKGKPIELWDIDRIVKLPPAGLRAAADGASAATANVDATGGQCDSDLVVRRNRSTGESFYGCSRYPSCRFTRPVKAQASGAS